MQQSRHNTWNGMDEICFISLPSGKFSLIINQYQRSLKMLRLVSFHSLYANFRMLHNLQLSMKVARVAPITRWADLSRAAAQEQWWYPEDRVLHIQALSQDKEHGVHPRAAT
jgi:hypothetical protein